MPPPKSQSGPTESEETVGHKRSYGRTLKREDGSYATVIAGCTGAAPHLEAADPSTAAAVNWLPRQSPIINAVEEGLFQSDGLMTVLGEYYPPAASLLCSCLSPHSEMTGGMEGLSLNEVLSSPSLLSACEVFSRPAVESEAAHDRPTRSVQRSDSPSFGHCHTIQPLRSGSADPVVESVLQQWHDDGGDRLCAVCGGRTAAAADHEVQRPTFTQPALPPREYNHHLSPRNTTAPASNLPHPLKPDAGATSPAMNLVKKAHSLRQGRWIWQDAVTSAPSAETAGGVSIQYSSTRSSTGPRRETADGSLHDVHEQPPVSGRRGCPSPASIIISSGFEAAAVPSRWLHDPLRSSYGGGLPFPPSYDTGDWSPERLLKMALYSRIDSQFWDLQRADQLSAAGGPCRRWPNLYNLQASENHGRTSPDRQTGDHHKDGLALMSASTVATSASVSASSSSGEQDDINGRGSHRIQGVFKTAPDSTIRPRAQRPQVSGGPRASTGFVPWQRQTSGSGRSPVADRLLFGRTQRSASYNVDSYRRSSVSSSDTLLLLQQQFERRAASHATAMALLRQESKQSRSLPRGTASTTKEQAARFAGHGPPTQCQDAAVGQQAAAPPASPMRNVQEARRLDSSSKGSPNAAAGQHFKPPLKRAASTAAAAVDMSLEEQHELKKMRKREYARNRYYEQQTFRNALAGEASEVQATSLEIRKEIEELKRRHETLSCREEELKSVYRVLKMENRTLRKSLATRGVAVEAN